MHSVVLGSIIGILIGLVTEYYTGIEPVFEFQQRLFLTLVKCPRQVQRRMLLLDCLLE